MVWGMSLPSGFGDFWPSGEAEYDKKTRESGWGDRLRLFYLAQAPEEQRRLLDYGENHVGYGAGGYRSYVAGKFFSEHGADKLVADRYHFGSPEHPCSKVYIPVEPHEAPQSYTTEKSYQALGSFIQLSGLAMAVDEPLKEIIERLEPGVHQFFPIEIRMPRGKLYPTQYYTVVIGQYLDSFSPENSDEYAFRENGKYGYIHERNKAGVIGLAFSKSAFGNAHLWRERCFRQILFCFSDELQAEIIGAGLRVPKHYKMMEV